MAGQPIWKAFCSRVDALGGIEYIIGRIANGETLLGITRDLKTSRYMVWRYINLTKERAARYAQARREGAAALAEEALEIADNADDSAPAGVQKAKLQVDSRKWLAGVHDREGYGDTPKAAGNTFNVGTMHLHALQQHGGPEAQTSLPAPRQLHAADNITDADIIEEGDTHEEGSASTQAAEAGTDTAEADGAGGSVDIQLTDADATEVRHAEVDGQLSLL